VALKVLNWAKSSSSSQSRTDSDRMIKIQFIRWKSQVNQNETSDFFPLTILTLLLQQISGLIGHIADGQSLNNRPERQLFLLALLLLHRSFFLSVCFLPPEFNIENSGSFLSV
jgi:hypothetical protein